MYYFGHGIVLSSTLYQQSSSYAGTATSGRAFSGDVTRKFSLKQLRFSAGIASHRLNAQFNDTTRQRFAQFSPTNCESTQWGVVTTIFGPSDAIRKVARLNEWCLVVVADEKTNDELFLNVLLEKPDRIVYLSVERQRAMASSSLSGSAVREFVSAMPWSHCARKNIGYLFAIGHGARLVFDFDDDNELKVSGPIPCKQGIRRCTSIDVSSPPALSQCTGHASLFNPYPAMGASTSPSWPRGFPLEHIKSRAHGRCGNAKSTSVHTVSLSRVGTIQLLADNGPDVDAIFRLTQPLPFTFNSHESMMLPPGSYAPTNAHATLHTYDALWSTLLPVTVHGRVADIWRGYVAQRAFHDLGLAVVFAPPRINQTRTAYTDLVDMSAEQDLYLKSGALVRFLADQWKDDSTTLPARLEQLAVALYEREFIRVEDVYCTQKWISALLEVGYIFPAIKLPMQRVPLADVARDGKVIVMGQFNFIPCASCVETWSRAWATLTPNVDRYEIYAAVPNGTSSAYAETRAHIIRYRSDKGFYSPYINLADMIRMAAPDVRGVLYVHDDLLLTRSLLYRVGGTEWVTPFNITTRSGYVQRDGVVKSAGGGWSRKYARAIKRVAGDPRMEPYWITDRQGHRILSIGNGLSDMLYISISDADHTAAFLTLLDVFSKHKLFLEVAIPTAVLLMKQRYDIAVYSANLCDSYDWGSPSRGSDLPACAKNDGIEIVHPIKLGRSLSIWRAIFDNITRPMNDHMS